MQPTPTTGRQFEAPGKGPRIIPTWLLILPTAILWETSSQERGVSLCLYKVVLSNHTTLFERTFSFDKFSLALLWILSLSRKATTGYICNKIVFGPSLLVMYLHASLWCKFSNYEEPDLLHSFNVLFAICMFMYLLFTLHCKFTSSRITM